jgi:hypothetical protein
LWCLIGFFSMSQITPFKNTLRSFAKQIHKLIAPLAILVLVYSTSTGFFYSFVRTSFRKDFSYRKWVLLVHEMYIDPAVSLCLNIIFCFVLLWMTVSGLLMIKWNPHLIFQFPDGFQALHNQLATFMSIWLSVVGLTGAIYSIMKILSIELQYYQWLMWIHAASFNHAVQIMYTTILLNCVGLEILSGVVLYWRFLKQWIADYRKKSWLKKEKITTEEQKVLLLDEVELVDTKQS